MTKHSHHLGGLLLVATATCLLMTGSAQASSQQFHTLVLLGKFANYNMEYITPAQAASYVFTATDSLAAFEQEVSYGQFTVTGDASGWYTLPAADANCDFGTWGNELRDSAIVAGINFSAYDHVIYNFSAGPGCAPTAAFGGGDLNSGSVWIFGPKMVDVSGKKNLLYHEFGHSIGLPHAGQTNCFVGCALNDLGDSYDTMSTSGGGGWGYNGSYRAELGILSQTPVLASGTYTVQRLASPTGDRVLQVPRPDGTVIEVDYRNGGGQFELPGYDKPVGVRLVMGTTGRRQSYLVAGLQQGYRVYDSASGTLIQDLGGGPTSAQVSVQLGVPTPPVDTTAPTASVLTGVRGGPKGNPTETLTWSGATDDVAVTGYNIYQNNTRLYSLYADQSSTVVYPPKKGTASWTVTATDQAGNESVSSNTVTG